MQTNKQIFIFGGVALVVIAVIAGLAVMSGGSQYAAEEHKMVDAALLVKDNSHMTGEKSAKVTVVEFGDYQCPACGAAHPIVKQMLEAYKNNKDVNFVFRNFPLPQHKNARVAAEAAEEAGAQDKFWEMHDALYEHQSEWSDSDDALSAFANYARQIGMDADKLRQEVGKSAFEDAIQADVNDGNAAGVNSTPTFFINGSMMVGVPSIGAFKAAIDAKLK